MTQEESQEEMMVMTPQGTDQDLCGKQHRKTTQMIQTRVDDDGAEDVEQDTRILSRSTTSGLSRYPSWTFLPEYIFRRRVR